MMQHTLPEALTGINSISGWLSINEAVWLYEQALQHDRILEIGCWKGRSTFCLTQGCVLGGLVVTVDHFQGSGGEDQFWYDNASGGDFKGVRESFLKSMCEPLSDGRLLLMDMYVDVFYSVCTYVFDHHKFDMIFIDGSHNSRSFTYDLTECQKLLAPNGLLCGHDATHRGVKPVLDSLVPGYTVIPDTTIWVASPLLINTNRCKPLPHPQSSGPWGRKFLRIKNLITRAAQSTIRDLVSDHPE